MDRESFADKTKLPSATNARWTSIKSSSAPLRDPRTPGAPSAEGMRNEVAIEAAEAFDVRGRGTTIIDPGVDAGASGASGASVFLVGRRSSLVCTTR